MNLFSASSYELFFGRPVRIELCDLLGILCKSAEPILIRLEQKEPREEKKGKLGQ